ncbi:MAG: RNA polymerase sigma factor [Chloroflexi bacterium]|nr:RNA polymerase sigma factor [Chloroflexota bacterium]
MKIFVSTGVNTTKGMGTAETSQVIEKCLAGDEQAIERFVSAHKTDVFRLALSIVQDVTTANEIAQETFIAALKSLRTYREKSSLKAWLYTIALNTSRSHLRRQRALDKLRTTLTSILRADSQRQSTPEDAIIQSEKEKAIWKALNGLDEKHRTVMVLRYFQELTVAEIAEILSISEGTIHSRLHTARDRLRNALMSLHGE